MAASVAVIASAIINSTNVKPFSRGQRRKPKPAGLR